MELRRRICLLGIFLLTCTMFWIHSAWAKTLYIGDSRTVGMASSLGIKGGECSGGYDTKHCKILNSTDASGNRWFSQVGARSNLLSGNMGTINKLASDCNEIVISLGANDIDRNNPAGAAGKYAALIKQIAQANPGKKIIVSSVNPVDESKYKGYKNSDIEKFNQALKKGISDTATYADTYSCMKGQMGKAGTGDGLHYTNNSVPYNCLTSAAKITPSAKGKGTPNNSTTDDGSSGGGNGGGDGSGGGGGGAGNCDVSDEDKKASADKIFDDAKTLLEKLNTYKKQASSVYEGVCKEFAGKESQTKNNALGNVLKKDTGDHVAAVVGEATALETNVVKGAGEIAKDAAKAAVKAESNAVESATGVNIWESVKTGVKKAANWTANTVLGEEMANKAKNNTKKTAEFIENIDGDKVRDYVRGAISTTNLEKAAKLTDKRATIEGVGSNMSLKDMTGKLQEFVPILDLSPAVVSLHAKKAGNSACEQALTDLIPQYNEINKLISSINNALDVINGMKECECEEKDNMAKLASMNTSENIEGAANLGYCGLLAAENAYTEEECRSVLEYQSDFTAKCLICDLFATLESAAQSIAKAAFDSIVKELIMLLTAGLLIYIAYLTLLTIASPEPQKISKYLTSLLSQGAKVAITVLILQNPSFLYKNAVNPILDGGVDFGMSLIDVKANDISVNKALLSEKGKKYAEKFDQSSEFLNAQTLQNMVGAAESFNDALTQMPAIGRALICRSFEATGVYQRTLKFLTGLPPHTKMFIEGCILYIFGIMIWLAVGFYMIDCIIALGFVCTMMAFFIACWPFKLTSNYTKIGWNMFLNIFFNFVMMGVIVTAIVEISGQSISGGIPVDEFISAINGDTVTQLESLMDLGGLQLLLVVVCALICFKLPKEIGNLANKFSGGLQVKLGADLGAKAADYAKKVVGRTVRVAANATMLGAKVVGDVAIDIMKKAKSEQEETLGKFGIGPKSKMASKGRNKSANTNTDTSSGFNQDQ